MYIYIHTHIQSIPPGLTLPQLVKKWQHHVDQVAHGDLKTENFFIS